MEFDNLKQVIKMFKDNYKYIITRGELEDALVSEYLYTYIGDFSFYYDRYKKKYILEV